MIDYILSFQFTSFLALFVYWIPAAICIVVYFFRSIATYKQDLERCENKYYTPELTIGLIIWWIICAICPAGNIFALILDCASSVFKWLGNVLDFPLVRHRPMGDSQK